VALIETEELRHGFPTGGGVVWALNGIELTINESEFVAVIGPSGSGKSTLLNILGCLGTPTAGHYRLEGTEITTLTRQRLASIRSRKIGFIFQNFGLLQHSTALENAELPLIYSGVPATRRRISARLALERVGLADRLQHTPGKLSGGQQQRVAIARALVNSPSLLLADEPTGALDTQTSQEVMGLFEDINRRDGVTIVIVTHDPTVASHASRMIVLRDGRIASDVRSGRRRMAQNAAQAEALEKS
jgi:putative ABC transport system ATP-binding protein